MTNFEKIKNMSVEEAIEILSNSCSMCVYQNEECQEKYDATCHDGKKQWLQSEAD